MKKVVTLESFAIPMMAAVGAGFGYAIPSYFNMSTIVCIIICLVVGILFDEITSKILLSRYVQSNKIRRLATLTLIVIIFALSFILLIYIFNYSLIDDYGIELLFSVVFPILMFFYSYVQYSKKLRDIYLRYGYGEKGFSLNEEEKEYVKSLSDQNQEIIGDYNESLSVKTKTGIFVGKRESNVIGFLGIPYAMPPVNERRFAPPSKLEESDKVYEAYYYGASCPQYASNKNPIKELRQSEDCLHLNVWISKNNIKEEANKPVVVYIHGGDGSYGSSANPIRYGGMFVKNNQDIVFVSVNYRYGVLGFLDLSHASDSDKYRDYVNVGILDQIAALNWIKENIKSFGGNPDDITLMGDSFGSCCIQLLSVCEKAKGLFNKAILITPYIKTTNADIRKKKLMDEVMSDLKVSTIEELLKVDEEKIVNYLKTKDISLEPICDGKIIPLNPVEEIMNGNTGNVSFIYGLGKDEIGGYASIIEDDEFNRWLDTTIVETLEKYSDEEKKKINDWLANEEAKLGIRRAKMNLLNNLIGIKNNLILADSLKNNGKNVRVLYWDTDATVKNFGVGTVEMVCTILDNGDVSESLGTIVDDDIVLIIQNLLKKFIENKKVELYKNEIKGTESLNWKQYPYILKVTDNKITCSKSISSEYSKFINRIYYEL